MQKRATGVLEVSRVRSVGDGCDCVAYEADPEAV
jgi:hypothetical protein